MADAPKPALESLLGREGCARLRRALTARALRWAEGAGTAYLAYADEETAALAPAGARAFAQVDGHPGERLGAAFEHVAGEHEGPVVVVGTDQPALSASHAWGAADDLREGVDVTLGPATAGGYYLLGARRYDPALFDIDPDAWGGPRVMELTLESVLGAGMSIGWLRSERDLDDPRDVAALLADPCAPADIREVLAS